MARHSVLNTTFFALVLTGCGGSSSFNSTFSNRTGDANATAPSDAQAAPSTATHTTASAPATTPKQEPPTSAAVHSTSSTASDGAVMAAYPTAKQVADIAPGSGFALAGVTKAKLCAGATTCTLYMVSNMGQDGPAPGVDLLVAARSPAAAPSRASRLDDSGCASINTSTDRIVECTDSSGNTDVFDYHNNGTVTVANNQGVVTVPEAIVPPDPDPTPSPAPGAPPSGVFEGIPYQCLADGSGQARFEGFGLVACNCMLACGATPACVATSYAWIPRPC